MATSSEKYALISVYDKTDVTWLGEQLQALGYKILATGGTAKLLEQAGLNVTEVSDFTKEPEMFAGRVKTLHPKIFGGVLFNRERQEDIDDSCEHSIPPIDVVAVNFYPFEEKALKQKLPLDQAIEFVDIGGPSLLRSAAKNWKHTVPVSSPQDYKELVSALRENQFSDLQRQKFAARAFKLVLDYDQLIADYFVSQTQEEQSCETIALRYGENPGQEASLIRTDKSVNFETLHGKALSYNNILDVDSGLALVKDFAEHPVFAILKHTNPCGVAWGQESVENLFRRALSSDPLSAFGGIAVTNQKIDLNTAKALNETFLECVIAPGFSEEALTSLKKKINRRLIKVDLQSVVEKEQMRTSHLGVLKQGPYPALVSMDQFDLKAGEELSTAEKQALMASLAVVKHIKSNGIVLVNNGQTIGVACGHVSRIDALKHAIRKANEFNHSLEGSYLASDAFFPFRDCVDLAAEQKVKAIVQPGGSVRDEESIAASKEHNISLYFCGQRYFKH